MDTVPLLMRVMRGAMRRRLVDDEPASLSHVWMLNILHERQHTMRELAARYHVTPSTMSRTVDNFVRRAWIERRADPEDRRQVLLRLTDDGQQIHNSMQDHAYQSVAELVRQLDEAEVEQLYQGLNVLQRMIARADLAGRPCAPFDEREPRSSEEETL
jgi:DNA-binding MarR family transcriptional regulator